MTADQEVWACALAIERQYTDRAATHVAERIGALVLAGDLAGVARWKRIAACLDAMQGAAAGSLS